MCVQVAGPWQGTPGRVQSEKAQQCQLVVCTLQSKLTSACSAMLCVLVVLQVSVHLPVIIQEEASHGGDPTLRSSTSSFPDCPTLSPVVQT